MNESGDIVMPLGYWIKLTKYAIDINSNIELLEYE